MHRHHPRVPLLSDGCHKHFLQSSGLGGGCQEMWNPLVISTPAGESACQMSGYALLFKPPKPPLIGSFFVLQFLKVRWPQKTNEWRVVFHFHQGLLLNGWTMRRRVEVCAFCFFKIYLLILPTLGLHCFARFSSCSKWGYSRLQHEAFHCSGFSCLGSQALGLQTSVVAA